MSNVFSTGVLIGDTVYSRSIGIWKCYFSQNKQVIIKYGEKAKYKTDCLIADETNSVKLVLWESIIDKIQAGKTYNFRNLKVSIFDDVKYFNTYELTGPQEIEDLHNINLTTPKIQDNTIESHCIGVLIEHMASCIVCHMTIMHIKNNLKRKL